jgi:hypothetical protein
MGFICHRFLAVVVQTWVWSKDAMFGFSVPHREKLCAIIRVTSFWEVINFLKCVQMFPVNDLSSGLMSCSWLGQ